MTSLDQERWERKLDVPENVRDWMAKVRQTNDRFDEATPSEKRVMIAQDVLLAIEAGRLTAGYGKYVPRFSCDSDSVRATHNVDVWADAVDYRRSTEQAVMPIFGENCRVCAKGALFVAKLDRCDGTRLRDMRIEDPSRHLRDLFSRLQLDLVECAFEGCVAGAKPYKSYAALSGDSPLMSFEEYHALMLQAAQYCEWDVLEANSARLRLRKIMTNIVENGGTFDPTKDVKAVFHDEAVGELAQTTGADGKA